VAITGAFASVVVASGEAVVEPEPPKPFELLEG
jgi:hypothetical protein